MANRYANLVGSNKIKDEYQKINIGFDKVEQEMDEKPDNSFARINDVEAEGEDAFTIEAGTGITITTNPEEKKIRITATGEATPGPHGSEHNHDGSDPIPDLVQLRVDLNDIKTPDPSYTPDRPIDKPGDMTRDMQNQFTAHLDEDVTQEDHPHGIIYERGIFTPEYTPEVGEFDKISYTINTKGLYVRRNSEVTIYLLIQTSSIEKGTASGGVRITGIPFAAFDTTNAISVGFFRRFGVGVDRIFGFINGDYVALYKGKPSDDSPASLTVDDLTHGSNNNTLRLSATYLID